MISINPLLFDRMKTGDHDAFNIMMEQFQHFVFAISVSILHDEYLAQDCVQMTFIKLYHHLHRLHSAQTFPSLVALTSTRIAYDMLRKRKEEAWQPHFDETKGGGETSDAFSTWHASLTPLENQIVAYVLVYELDFALIAKMLKKSKSTIHRLYQASLQKIKEDYV